MKTILLLRKLKALATTVACGAALLTHSATADTTLRVWGLSGPSGEYFAGALKRFEKANPGIVGKFSAYPNEQYKTAIQVGVRSADPPDVYQNWAFERAARMMRDGFAVDIGDFTKELSATALSEYTFKGKLYGVPFDRHGKYMWYNVAYFRDHNLSPPNSFDELIDLCKKIRATDPQMVPIGLGASEPWTIDAYISVFNQKLVPEDVRKADTALSAPADSLFTDLGYIAALQKILDMQSAGCFNDGITALTPEAARSMFANGMCAMHYEGTWCLVVFDNEGLKNGYQGFRLPDFKNQKGSTGAHLIIADGFQVHPITEKRGTRESAIAFLKFILSPQEQAEFAKETKALPSVPAARNYLSDATPIFLWALKDTSEATVEVAHLDTTLDRAISDVYLRGYQDLVNHVKTPEQIMSEVHNEAVLIQKQRNAQQ
ncbi:MAG: carbohydrate ABC transporter substrate-binding protein [Verrucomicrobia bacterium]|nr:carbohydrate ABC transporter substrate-binding protein [Verrucomicrobiota bacterium]